MSDTQQPQQPVPNMLAEELRVTSARVEALKDLVSRLIYDTVELHTALRVMQQDKAKLEVEKMQMAKALEDLKKHIPCDKDVKSDSREPAPLQPVANGK